MKHDPRNPNATARLSEQGFMSALLIELNALPRVRAYRRNAGRMPNGDGGMVKVGVAGQCDIWLLAWPGIHVEVECKVKPGKLTALQARWREIVTTELGALYVLAETPPEFTAAEASRVWAAEVGILLHGERARRGVP